MADDHHENIQSKSEANAESDDCQNGACHGACASRTDVGAPFVTKRRNAGIATELFRDFRGSISGVRPAAAPLCRGIARSEWGGRERDVAR